ncbi:MAG TPA: hypothetical protein VKU85_02290, partial [bacterium]|nr:hypothetical protein [bacterium]
MSFPERGIFGFLIAAAITVPLPAPAQQLDTSFPVPFGVVNCMDEKDGILYLGGRIAGFGRGTGGFAVLDPVEGAVVPSFPPVVGG